MFKYLFLAASVALTTVPAAEAGSRYGIHAHTGHGTHYGHGYSLSHKHLKPRVTYRHGRHFGHNRFHTKRKSHRHFHKRSGVVLKFGHGARGGITIYRQPRFRHHR